MKRFYPFLILLIAFLSITVESCKKEVEGCTDKDAVNYNAEATVSTSCTFERDKFIGTYVGSLSCPNPLLASISGTTTFTIDESIAGGKNDVVINITTTTGLVVPVTGTCEGDKVVINTTLKGVSVTVPSLGVIVADIIAKGEATYTESNKTLAGPLNLTITYSGLEIADICGFTGTKQ